MKSKGIRKGWIALLAALALTLALCFGALADGEVEKLDDSLLDDVKIPDSVMYLDVLQNKFALTIPEHAGVDHYLVAICREGNEDGNQWVASLEEENTEDRAVVVNPFDGGYEELPAEGGNFTLRIYAYPGETDDDELAACRQAQILIEEYLWQVEYPVVLTTEEFSNDGLTLNNIPYAAEIDHYGFWLERVLPTGQESVYVTITVSNEDGEDEFASLTIKANDEEDEHNTLKAEPGLYFLDMHAYPTAEATDEEAELVHRVIQVMDVVPEGDVTLTLNPEHGIFTDSTIALMSYAPGADYQIIHITDENGEEFFHWEGPGEVPAFDLHSGFNRKHLNIHVTAFYYQKNDDGSWILDEDGEAVDERDPVEVDEEYEISANYDVEIERPEVPDYLNATEGYSFTIRRPNYATVWDVNVWKDTTDGTDGGLFYSDILSVEGDDDQEVTSWSFDIAEGALTNAQFLNIEIHGWGQDVQENDVTFSIPVAHPKTEGLTLTIGGLDGLNTIVNYAIPLHLEIPDDLDVKTVCVFDGNGFWNHEGPDEDGNYTRDISFSEDKTYPVYVMVTCDEIVEGEEDNREWLYSNVVTVSAAKDGDVGPLTISYVDQEEDYKAVTRGDTVQVQLSYSDNAENYYINSFCNLDEGEEGWGYDFQWDWLDEENHIAVIYTSSLQEGKYYLSGGANAPGYIGYDSVNDNVVVYLDINEPENQSFTFQVLNTEISTGDTIHLNAYAPGANWIDVYYDGYDNEQRAETFGNYIGESRTPYWTAGEYTVAARAWYPRFDENDEPVYEYDEEGNLQYGDNGDPIQVHDPVDCEVSYVISVSADGDVLVSKPGLPTYIRYGEGLNFTAWRPQNAENYEVNVWWDDDNGGLYYENGIEDEMREVNISADAIPDFETWVHVKIYGNAHGKNDQELTWDIPVVPNPSDEVTLEITGLDPDGTLPVNRKAQLKVTANNGKQIQTVSIFNGDGYWDHEGPDEDGTYTREISYSEWSVNVVYAMVTFDEWKDEYEETGNDPRTWVYSNILEIVALTNGQVDPLTISYVGQEEDYKAVTRGDTVQVQLSESEHATDYYVNAHCNLNEDEDGWDYDFHWEWLDEGNHIAIIYTSGMETGSYYLSGGAHAEGWNGYDSANDNVVVYLDINEPQEQSFTFQVLNTQISTGDAIRLNAYAPGADWIDVYYGGFDNEEWAETFGGNYIGESCTPYWTAGEYTIEARAWYPKYDEDGEPVYEYDEEGNSRFGYDDEGYPTQAHAPVDCDAITIYVSANGDVEIIAPEELPPYIRFGEGLNFTVQKPMGAENYEINVWWDNEDGGLYYENELTDEFTEVNISADAIPDFETWVHVKIYGKAHGMNDVEQTWDLQVVPNSSDDATLAITGLDWDSTIPVNRNVQLQVYSNNGQPIQTISIFDGDHYWDHDGPDEDGTYTRDISFGSPGTYAVYAMVTFDEWHDEYEEMEADPRTWIYTNIVTVTATSEGEVGPLTIFYPDQAEDEYKAVTRGDTVQVQLSNSENATEYYINSYCNLNEDEDGWGYDFRWEWLDEENHIAIIYTAGMRAGSYYLSGGAHAEGWNRYDSANDNVVVYLDVNEPEEDQNFIFQVLNTEISTGDAIRLNAYAPGADWIDVFYDGYDNEEWAEPFGGDYIGESRQPYWTVGEFTICAKAWYPVYDGEEPVWEKDDDGNIRQDDEGNNIPQRYSVESGAYMVTVSAQGDVRIVTPPELKDYLQIGDDLSFTAIKPENADWYEVNVWWDDENGGLYYENNLEVEGIWVNIPADAIPDFDTWVHVKIYGRGNGFNDAEETFDIHVIPNIGALSSTFRLTLPNAIESIEEEAFAGVNMELVILTENVGDLWNYLNFLNETGTRVLVIPEGSDWDAYNGIGDFAVIYQSQYDEIMGY